MNKHLISALALVALLLVGASTTLAQTTPGVGIGTTTPDASAALDLSSTSKGLLIPRMTSAQAAAIASPADGLLVYRTDGVQPGLWYYKGGVGWTYVNPTGGADNLGNHSATQNLVLNQLAIYLNTASDPNHQLRYSGGPNGPQLFGYGGGELGATSQGYYQPVLRWTGDGNVGIGTDSPALKLEVAGTPASPYSFPEALLRLTRPESSGYKLASTAEWRLSSYSVDSDAASRLDLALGDATSNEPNATILTALSNGHVGIGTTSPENLLDLVDERNNARSGDHATGRPLYVTGEFGAADSGVEFRHNNGTQGLGFGYNSVYAAGSTANQHLNLIPKGTGNVGVGTLNPSQKLEVAGSVKISGSGSGLVFADGTVQTTAPAARVPQTLSVSGQTLSISGGGNSVTLPPAATDNLGNHTATQNLNLSTYQLVGNGGTSGLAINSGGNVGIGTAAPAQKLDVAGTVAPLSAGTEALLRLTRPNNVGQKFANTAELRLGTYTSSVRAASRLDVVLGEGNTNTPDMTVLTALSNGDVGIGTTMPGQRLEVVGNIKVSGGGTGLIFADGSVQTTAAGSQTLSLSGQTLSITNGNSVTIPNTADNLGNHTATQNLNLAANQLVGNGGTNGISISSSGNVGVGITNPQNSLDLQNGALRSGTHATGRALYVTGDFGAADSGVEFRHNNGTQGVGIGYNSLYAAGSNTNQDLNLMPKGTGNVGIGTTSPQARLDVVGTARVSALAGAGVRTVGADANGNLVIGNGTANNGLNATNGVIQLGGSLIQATDIQAGAYPLRVYGLVNSQIDQQSIFPPNSANPTNRTVTSSSVYTIQSFRVGHTGQLTRIDAAMVGGGTYTMTLYRGEYGSGTAITTSSATGGGDANVGTAFYFSGISVTAGDDMYMRIRADNTGATGAWFERPDNYGNGYGWDMTVDFGFRTYVLAGALPVMAVVGGNLGVGVPGTPVAPIEIQRDDASAYITMHDPGDNWFSFGQDKGAGNNIKINDGSDFSGTNFMTITRGAGYVGIGTTNPSAKLDVAGTGNIGSYNLAYYAYNSGSNAYFVGASTNSSSDVSIRANGRIVGSEFNATSDRRLKQVIGLSDRAADLALLTKLRITDYTMRDRAEYGNRQFKKVIAQEVEEVFPQAVQQHTGFLPDIYTPATAALAEGDSLLRLILPTAPATTATVSQAVKLIGPNGLVIGTVARPASGTTLVVRGARELAGQHVFVFGLEHADVRTVDYEALAMLNVSATQELAHQLAALRQQTQEQACRLEAQQDTLQTLQSQANETASLAQRLQALENLLGTRAEASR